MNRAAQQPIRTGAAIRGFGQNLTARADAIAASRAEQRQQRLAQSIARQCPDCKIVRDGADLAPQRSLRLRAPGLVRRWLSDPQFFSGAFFSGTSLSGTSFSGAKD